MRILRICRAWGLSQFSFQGVQALFEQHGLPSLEIHILKTICPRQNHLVVSGALYFRSFRRTPGRRNKGSLRGEENCEIPKSFRSTFPLASINMLEGLISPCRICLLCRQPKALERQPKYLARNSNFRESGYCNGPLTSFGTTSGV
jgi:hypothetical protein